MRTERWLAILIFLLLGCAGGDHQTVGVDPGDHSGHGSDKVHAVHWGYGNDDGPERWSDLSPDWAICDTGTSQSPIDISDAALTSEADGIALGFPAASVRVHRQEHALAAKDNGHTIVVKVGAGDTLTLGDRAFDLLQYHFHSPSEHTVNGNHYPMEMHLVHRSEAGELAVVGVFIEEGEQNAAFDAVWSRMPLETGEEVRAEQVQASLDDMLPSDTASWRYHGSLTTPPCSEGVSWIVMQTPIHLDAEQIEQFRKEYTGNNRPPQPLNDRPLVTDSLVVQ